MPGYFLFPCASFLIFLYSNLRVPYQLDPIFPKDSDSSSSVSEERNRLFMIKLQQFQNKNLLKYVTL